MWNLLSVSIWAAYKNCSFSNTPFYGNNQTSPQGQTQLPWSRIILAPKTIHDSKCQFPYMPDELQYQPLSLDILGDEAMEKRKKLLVRQREKEIIKKREKERCLHTHLCCPVLCCKTSLVSFQREEQVSPPSQLCFIQTFSAFLIRFQ